jgi:hypothetical protein
MDALVRYIIKHHKNNFLNIKRSRMITRNVRISGIPKEILTMRALNIFAMRETQEVFEKYLMCFWTYKLLDMQSAGIFTYMFITHILEVRLPERGIQVTRCGICKTWIMKKNTTVCKKCNTRYCDSGTRFCGFMGICHTHN